MSSTLSETSRAASPALSTSTRGTWSRAPRQSFSGFQRPSTPDRLRKPRQKYVANPQNKLDVALGDIINNLPVDINVEAVTNTWKDKSGKYWIGGNEPKLCFCRILRSQTVMVRVGGGWTELSKYVELSFVAYRACANSLAKGSSRTISPTYSACFQKHLHAPGQHQRSDGLTQQHCEMQGMPTPPVHPSR